MTKIEQAAAVVAAARAAYADADSLATASRQDIVDLLALTAELARVVDAQQVRLAGAIAERSTGADDESVCRLLGARNPKEAVASAFGIRGRDAGELLSLATATAAAVGLTGQDIAIKYPRVAAALDEGELSLAQARAIVTTLAPAAPRADLSQLAWAEGCLVDAATAPEAPLAPELLVMQARAYVAVLDPDGVLPNSERQHAMRSLRLWQRPDGIWRFDGCSPPEKGSALKALLDAYTSPRRPVAFTDDDDDAESDAAVEVEVEVDADDRTPEQKRHDVLIALVEAHAASGDAPIAGSEVPRLVLTGTMEAFSAYLRGDDHRDRSLTIEHTGSVVPIETADRLLCDGVVQRAVVDDEGHVLQLGREQRTFNRAQRRALAVQYGGCATPGCSMPVAWTEAHHAVWWRHGGPTDVENGILLCSYCHHEVHARRLLVVGTPGAWRVIAQLRPADRYARNRRTGVVASTAAADAAPASAPAALAHAAPAASASAALAHAAPAALAVRLPDPSPPPAVRDIEPPDGQLVPHLRRTPRTTGPIEARLRQRFPARRRPRCRPPAVDRRPLQQVVLRT
ncbi:HNH endonuclease signature motif containing protein [Agrococcus sp. ARC_14]|uniref:HNH endonuclease signature motif containing protein n=1 Tax=Agrococcus sp. ARC_14 TaxID=2919927 RepID=UPI001F058995|nr:HNH endonuclease [Agrococcus sp. ARC_14]